jgi:3-oxoacyl-[acyl-carrier protein] reductase
MQLKSDLLKGKTAVVTGCRKGIGRAVLDLFAANGADLFACVRTGDDDLVRHIDKLSDTFGVNIKLVEFDLRDPAATTAAARKIVEENRNVSVLVNNAAMMHSALLQMTSLEKMQEVFAVNFFHQVAFTQGLVRHMAKSKNASIINISSTAAIDGNSGRSAYASSKGALLTATRVMAREFADLGIRVNAIAPGLTATDMMAESTAQNAREEFVQKTMLKRIAEPIEIANVCLFLASELSSYVTGQVLRVDGGL